MLRRPTRIREMLHALPAVVRLFTAVIVGTADSVTPSVNFDDEVQLGMLGELSIGK
jgi:hypothetical protein